MSVSLMHENLHTIHAPKVHNLNMFLKQLSPLSVGAIQKLLGGVVVLCALFLMHGNSAHATVFTGTGTPTNYRALCTSGSPVDFAAYPSDVQYNTATSKVTYNIHVKWMTCGSTDTRAYAVYSDTDICPLSGTYSVGGNAYDCVKYIGDPAYSEPGSSLSCAAGTNSACVTSSFNGARRVVQRPPWGGDSIIIPMSVSASLSSSNRTWSTSKSMCQYYKSGTNFSQITPADRCQTIAISVSWDPGDDPQTTYMTATCDAISYRVSDPNGDHYDTALLWDDDLAINIGTNQAPSNTPGDVNSYSIANRKDFSVHTLKILTVSRGPVKYWSLSPERTVGPCAKPTNNPYLRASTNDVFSGALFEATPGDQCLAYNPFLRSSIGQAKIQTNTLNSLDLETKYQLTLRAVYHTMLGRGLNPSDPAIAAWRANPSLPWDTNFSAATSALISAISGSAEYKTTGLGKWQYATPSPNWNNFVTDLYTNSFGREADSGGLAAWTAGLSAGTQQPNSLIQRFVETEDVGAFGLGTNSYNGGIANYGGSGAEYAAFSTGSIPFGTNQGFVGYNGRVAQRAGNGAGDWRYDLLFSNDTASPYGSYTATPLCLPDLYDTYNDASKYTPILVTSMLDLSSKIASISTADPTVLKMSANFNLSGLTIPASKHIILLGPDANDVTITGNIIYAPYVLDATTNTVPSFQLITKGRNIMVNGTVSRLDGMYVAQPGVAGVAPSKTIDSNGVIQTCENYTGLCATTQLVVNGSLVAQHLKLNRTYGSVGYSWNNQTTQYNKACLPLTGYDYNSALGYNYLYRSGTPPASDVSGASPSATGGQGTVNACAAEWVNFSPEAYLSAAAATGSTNTSAAQSFQELPPIY